MALDIPEQALEKWGHRIPVLLQVTIVFQSIVVVQ